MKKRRKQGFKPQKIPSGNNFLTFFVSLYNIKTHGGTSMGKLKQASPVKFYFAKYFFLGFGLLQWTVATVLYLRFENTPKNASASFIFLCLGSILMVIFFYLHSSMK